MAGFDLHRLAAAHGGGLVVDVQSDLLDPFSTRVVVPLVAREAAPDAPRRLNPVIAVHDTPLILATHLLAALPRAALGPRSARSPTSATGSALDMLFLGF